MVKVLYNLLYYQVLVQISCNLTQGERSAVIGRGIICDQSNSSTSEAVLRTVINFFRDSELYYNDDVTSSPTNHARIRTQLIEKEVTFFCSSD